MLGTPSAVLAVLVVGVVVNGLLLYGVHSLRPTPTARANRAHDNG